MNSVNNKKYRIRLRALSPIFVGGGEDSKVSRLEYAYSRQGKKIYILDSSKWVEFLSENNLFDDYIKKVRESAEKKKGGLDNYSYLEKMVLKHKKDVEAVLKQVSYQILSTEKNPDFRTNDINLFQRNAENMPYIPGSGIKGAIETALLSWFYSNRRNISERYSSGILNQLNDRSKRGREIKKELDKMAKNIEKDAFDWKINECEQRAEIKGMSGISISDSKPFENSRLYLDRKRDLVIKDGRVEESKPSLYREYAEPGTETEFTLTIYPFRVKEELGITDIEDILRAIEKRWDTLYGEKGFFKTWSMIEKYLPKESIEDSRGLIILGGGAGYHSKSIVTALSKDKRQANEITKKIMHMNFSRHRHFNDSPISPRALKVSEYKGKKQLIGICRIEVL
jgi:CRISPR-associated protein Csm5